MFINRHVPSNLDLMKRQTYVDTGCDHENAVYVSVWEHTAEMWCPSCAIMRPLLETWFLPKRHTYEMYFGVENNLWNGHHS